MPLSWITGGIFPVMVLGSIFLALTASEQGNMRVCCVWLAVMGLMVTVRLAI
jgi:hypothetical protein